VQHPRGDLSDAAESEKGDSGEETGEDYKDLPPPVPPALVPVLPNLTTLSLALTNLDGDTMSVNHLTDILSERDARAKLARGDKEANELVRLVNAARDAGERFVYIRDVRAAASL